MNCQEFRKAWLEDTDHDVFAHIETCEDCIAWMEKQMTTDEEVQFLKEVPLPSVNLEERIMQAIYQIAGQGIPPHAATESLQPATPIANGKRRTKGFPSFAWVSAAAVLLAVGLIGYQQLHSNDQQMASQQQSDGNEAASQGLAFNKSQESQENQPKSDAATTPAQSPDTGSEKAAPAAGTPQPQPQAGAAADGSPAVPSAAEAPSVLSEAMLALNDSQAKTVSPESRTHTATQPPSRSAKVALPAGELGQKESAALADDTIAGKSSPQAVAEAGNPAEAANEPVYSLTAQALPESEQEAQAKGFAGPPSPAVQKAEITLSSFSDVDTAVQASDLPVPVLDSASGFAVSDISVQYESETSQRATRLTADYKRSKSWIKIDVVRNTHGKRSLSIPGTFTNTQLFTVGGEQAIGVSFDQGSTKETSVQHAVHFNTTAKNQSLYVVVTANGISLNELIETTKQLTWK